MHLELTDEQADVLRSVLDGVLGELSSEIAGTDNASFRAAVAHRRRMVAEVRGGLGEG